MRTQQSSGLSLARDMGRLGGSALLLLLGACQSATPDGVVAADSLLTLRVARVDGADVLTLTPAAGVKLNALLVPSIARPSGAPITFDAPGRTEDSAYFVIPPTARVTDARPLDGTLHASACPSGARLCLAVTMPVSLR